MATKVYLSGKNIIVDQDGQSLLTIRSDRARYNILQPFFSPDGKVPVPIYIEFKDVHFLTTRTEVIANVQDSGGGSFADLYYLQLYLDSFFSRANGDVIYTNPAITYSDSPNLDAFGRVRTSGTGQRLDVEFIYDKQEEIFDEIIVGAGIVTHNANSRDLLLEAKSVVNGDQAEMASYPIPYTPGNSQLIAMTGTLDDAGLGGGNAEVFLRSTVTGTTTEDVYTQSQWNVNGLSNIDWTQSQIFEMDFQSLKVGRIRFALNMSGVVVPFHVITNDNKRNTGYWQLPNLPLYWKIYNDATYTYSEMGYGNSDNGIGIRYKIPVNENAEMRAICGTVKSEGGLDIFDITGYNRSADMGTTSKTIGTTLVPIISIRSKSTFQTFDNLGLTIPLAVNIDTDNAIRFVVVHNAILTGASWSDVDTTESATEYDTSATSFTNGHVVHSDYIGTKKNTPINRSGILGKTLLWHPKGVESGTLTVCAVRTGSQNASVLASINFTEIR